MGLITCPDCGFEHSDLAPACPKCGRPKQSSGPSSNTSNLPKQFSEGFIGIFQDWKKMTVLGICLVVGVIFAPRIALFALNIWDPFDETRKENFTVWRSSGGQTASSFWFHDKVTRGCDRKDATGSRLFNPANPSPEHKVLNAVPQEMIVDYGSCHGTLYTVERTISNPTFSKLRKMYCQSSLVSGEHKRRERSGGYVTTGDQTHIGIGKWRWFPISRCTPKDYKN